MVIHSIKSAHRMERNEAISDQAVVPTDPSRRNPLKKILAAGNSKSDHEIGASNPPTGMTWPGDGRTG